MKLTVKEAAQHAHVSRSLIYGLLRAGRLRAIRVGVRGRGKWVIEKDALDAFLETCKAGVPSPATLPPLKHLR